MTFNNNENIITVRKRNRSNNKNNFCVSTIEHRVPIVKWLPQYNVTKLIQDLIAGVTVGLTAIPQGIAYAVVAGLSPEYGLYAGLMGGFVYLFFGSCKDITVGPTAIMSTLVAKYVSGYSADFAVLAAFLCGLVELLMGILHLGFLVEFISQPVICGFTTSAALQIAASQLKSLLGLSGSSGEFFAESMFNFFKSAKTIQLWDSVLGLTTILTLLCLKRIGQGCKRTDGFLKQLRWFMSLARNAVVVILGIGIAYCLSILANDIPFVVIGQIGSGLPSFKLPPFSSSVGNETYSFTGMLQVMGPQSIVLPLVAILETVAIAKAFAKGVPIDATQEMMALGICTIVGSFVGSMPVAGSFTRTALNNASGVQTPAGGIFTGLLIILALSLLTSTFYFIPKATLAGLIITAMFSMIEIPMLIRLWKTSKKELLIMAVTMVVCLSVGLEFGIVAGILIDALLLLYTTSRPVIKLDKIKCDEGELVIVPLIDRMSYCAAEHVRRAILEASTETDISTIIVIDGTNLRHMDTTVASNLISIAEDLESNSFQISFLNFSASSKRMCLSINSQFESKFVTASCASDVLTIVQKNV